jgi:hypothetical protein
VDASVVRTEADEAVLEVLAQLDADLASAEEAFQQGDFVRVDSLIAQINGQVEPPEPLRLTADSREGFNVYGDIEIVEEGGVNLISLTATSDFTFDLLNFPSLESDMHFKFKIKMLGASHYALAFRVSESSESYYAGYELVGQVQSAYLARYVDEIGGNSNLFTLNNFSGRDWQEWDVYLVGSTIRILLNGEQVFEYDDPSPLFFGNFRIDGDDGGVLLEYFEVEWLPLEISDEVAAASVLPASDNTVDPPPSTSSGISLYDDFEYTTEPDRGLWQYPADTFFGIDNGLMVLRAAAGDQIAPGSANIQTQQEWEIAPSGQVRFATEGWVYVDQGVTDSVRTVSSGFQVVGPGDYWFSVSIVHDFGRNYYFCQGAKGFDGDNLQYYFEEYGTPTFNEWHLLTATVEELPDSDDLVLWGYVDGQLFCTYTPPEEWQDAMQRGGYLTVNLNVAWQGELDLPLRVHYDDWRVGYPED